MITDNTVIICTNVKILHDLVVDLANVDLTFPGEEGLHVMDVFCENASVQSELSVLFALDIFLHDGEYLWYEVDVFRIYAFIVQKWVSFQVLVESTVIWVLGVT